MPDNQWFMGRHGRLFLLFVYYLFIGYLLMRVHWYSQADYYSPATGPDVQAQLNWIGSALRRGGGEATQAWYPEGFFFTHVLYGHALVNQALLDRTDEDLVARNIQEVKWVLERLDSRDGRNPFPYYQAVEFGVFYQGWRNHLLGGLLLITPNAERDPLDELEFHEHTAQLADAFAASPGHYLEAYPGQSWPVDNVVALTSLRLHDHLYHTGFGEVVDEWLAYSRANLDPATGLIPHRVDPRSGELLQGSRGSSLVLMLGFLPELDEQFSRSQYARYRELYSQPVLDFVLTREYPHGTFGFPDVDSGPLIGGLSPVASGVSLAAARANGDTEVFGRSVQLAELLGSPFTLADRKRYNFGLLPVGDAFLAWGKTLVVWSAGPVKLPVNSYPRLTSPFYPWTSFLAVLLALLPWGPTVLRKLRGPGGSRSQEHFQGPHRQTRHRRSP